MLAVLALGADWSLGLTSFTPPHALGPISLLYPALLALTAATTEWLLLCLKSQNGRQMGSNVLLIFFYYICLEPTRNLHIYRSRFYTLTLRCLLSVIEIVYIISFIVNFFAYNF